MSDPLHILTAIEENDPDAAAELLPLIYKELRALAARTIADEPPGQSLQATELLHEAYVRLVGNGHGTGWNGRGHFYAAAATAMRRILIERARGKCRQIHGGGLRRVELHPDLVITRAPDLDQQLSLDDALAQLAEHDPVMARLVELRYFAGLTGDEAARILGLSPRTADRQWFLARALLRRALGSDAPDDKINGRQGAILRGRKV